MAEQIQKTELATPQQAKDIFEAVEWIIMASGKDNGTRYTVPNMPASTPDAVAEHMPVADTDVAETESSLTLTQYQDSESGLTITSGLLGKVSFDETDTRVGAMPRIRDVSYLIVSEGGVLELERRTSIEDGEKKQISEEAGALALSQAAGPVSDEAPVDRLEAQAILDTLVAMGSMQQPDLVAQSATGALSTAHN